MVAINVTNPCLKSLAHIKFDWVDQYCLTDLHTLMNTHTRTHAGSEFNALGRGGHVNICDYSLITQKKNLKG